MALFYSHSIRRKLVLLLTGTASAAVVFACTMLWTYQFFHYRNTLRIEESATAQLIAQGSAAALLFNDSSAATETLAGLHADARVQQACLYDRQLRVLTSYNVDTQNSSCPSAIEAGAHFSRRSLMISRPIEIRSQQAGWLYLKVSLAEMYASLFRFAGTILCALTLSALFSLGLSSLLQRVISSPIVHLTDIANEVSRNGNYLLRAERRSEDEIGILIDQFNAMMEHIHRREEELQTSRSGLEDKVRERTHNLENEIVERKLIESDLESARIAAENANRAKSAFLANMSHELRTPLNAIIGYSEMLHEDANALQEVSMVHDLDNVLASARHLLTLISDILDLSKIEAGQMKVYPETIAAAVLIDDVVPTAEVLTKRNNNNLLIEQQGAEHWHVDVDPLRFRQCLLNLISNACKFTANGNVTLRVEMNCTEITPLVHFNVIDTGIGIPSEHLGKLFNTFSQIDDSNTRQFGGSGLGLAISQQLCRAMGGDITVESWPSVGSKFTIQMPCKKAPEFESQPPFLIDSAVVNESI